MIAPCSVLPRLAELHIRPPLLRQLQVGSARRQIREIPAAVDRKVLAIAVAKLLKLARILRRYLTRGVHVRILVQTVGAVLVAQTISHQIELQRTHGSHNELIALERLEHLARALLR